MTANIHRVTLFKIPETRDQQALLHEYTKLVANNQKDGKPYILNAFMGPAEDDPASQGYTVVSKTEFRSMDDMKYYADECPAHQSLKTFIRTLKCEGVLTVFFTPQVSGSAIP